MKGGCWKSILEDGRYSRDIVFQNTCVYAVYSAIASTTGYRIIVDNLAMVY